MRRWIAALSLAGVLFAGYLTVQWFRGMCTGGCSLLLGYPTCLYGLVMFSILLVASLLDGTAASWTLRIVSFIGILFSLWFVVQELAVCIWCYPLGLPNCVYGLAVYATIATLSWR